MSYPKFYDEVESIELFDPLSKVLGAFDDGKYAISYLEVVKSAGHSCPTVAGAYLMSSEALKALYRDETPVRGDIKVEFSESLEDGVAGVIANVITQVTGATDKSGFKGLNGTFARHSLMHFNADITASARFTRVSTSESVDVTYNPNSIAPLPTMKPLMQKMMQGSATEDELKEFALAWQDRVQRIFENRESVVVVKSV